jgi:hypothetical protein
MLYLNAFQTTFWTRTADAPAGGGHNLADTFTGQVLKRFTVCYMGLGHFAYIADNVSLIMAACSGGLSQSVSQSRELIAVAAEWQAVRRGAGRECRNGVVSVGVKCRCRGVVTMGYRVFVECGNVNKPHTSPTTLLQGYLLLTVPLWANCESGANGAGWLRVQGGLSLKPLFKTHNTCEMELHVSQRSTAGKP